MKCLYCGHEFKSHNPNPKYCSNSCKANGSASVDAHAAAILYGEGLTQKEVAERLGVSQKSVFLALRRIGVQCRRSIKRDQSGKRNSSWRGGKTITRAGYVQIRMPEHPRASSNGYVFEHIVVAEKAFGPLPEGVIVHHKNHIKDDNRPENLEVMSLEDHNRLHNRERLER
jgi:hypothetical protein